MPLFFTQGLLTGTRLFMFVRIQGQNPGGRLRIISVSTWFGARPSVRTAIS